MGTWQEILRDAFLHRRTNLHGPLYWTGWLIVKAISRGKYPSEGQPADVLMTLIGMTIWLGPLVALAVNIEKQKCLGTRVLAGPTDAWEDDGTAEQQRGADAQKDARGSR